MRKALVIIVVLLFQLFLTYSCRMISELDSEEQILDLNRIAYPVDTLELDGYCYTNNEKYKYIALFSKSRLSNPSDFESLLKTQKVALFYDAYSFNMILKNGEANLSVNQAINADSAVSFEPLARIKGWQESKVKGAFVMAVTNTFSTGSLISHSYEFRDNFPVIVMGPMSIE